MSYLSRDSRKSYLKHERWSWDNHDRVFAWNQFPWESCERIQLRYKQKQTCSPKASAISGNVYQNSLRRSEREEERRGRGMCIRTILWREIQRLMLLCLDLCARKKRKGRRWGIVVPSLKWEEDKLLSYPRRGWLQSKYNKISTWAFLLQHDENSGDSTMLDPSMMSLPCHSPNTITTVLSWVIEKKDGSQCSGHKLG